MRRIAWVIVPIFLVGLLALAIFTARGPSASTAFTLAARDCFDIPTDAQVGDLPTIPCTQSHDAEAFVAAAIASGPVASDSDSPSAGGPVPYPGPDGIAQWVSANCDASTQQAFLAAGAPRGLAVGYFFPSADAWAQGEHHVTCYLHLADGSKLSAPLDAASGSASPS